jgi:hypothetical protein
VPEPFTTTVRSVVVLVRPLLKVTFGVLPNAPVTLTLSEVAPDFVTVQPAEVELELQAAMVTTSDPAMSAAPRSFVMDRFCTVLLSCGGAGSVVVLVLWSYLCLVGEKVETVFPSWLWAT